MKENTVVMQGSLSEFALSDVLQVLGLCRQHTLVELEGDGQRPFAQLWLKSGRVMAVKCDGLTGRAAFQRLFGAGARGFRVIRLPEAHVYPEPLGLLGAMVLEATQPPAPPPVALLEDDIDDEALAVALGFEADAAELAGEATEVLELRPLPASGKAGAGSSVSTPLSLSQRTSANVASRSPRARVIGVCSPKGGVGKTTLALNLAFSLAQRGQSTVLVDADVNNDQLSLLDARGKAKLGTFDLLSEEPSAMVERLDSAMLETSVPKLRVLPACGSELPAAALERKDRSAAWAKLLETVASRADVVLVDCPAGMFDTTRDVLSGCSHALGVFQSEMVSVRSFEQFERSLHTLAPSRRPELAGVVVNMFQGKCKASLEAFLRISTESGRYRLFDTTVPRHDAFLSASLAGVPLRYSDAETAQTLAFLFDMLADELATRVSLERPAGEPRRLFL